MIIQHYTELQLLRFLCNRVFEEFSVVQLSKETKLSRNWLYKIIKNLKKYDLVKEYDNKIKLNFFNSLVKKLKLMFDSEFIESLEEEYKTRINEIANKILLNIDLTSLVLIGSFATKTYRKDSDMDFLLVVKEKESLPLIPGCNIIQMTVEEFNKKHSQGEDFVIGALKFGKIIEDKSFFINFYSKPLLFPSFEIIEERKRNLQKMKDRVYELLEIEDLSAAFEEIKKLLIQNKRIEYLQKGIIPESKKSLIEEDKKLKKLFKRKSMNKKEMLDLLETI